MSSFPHSPYKMEQTPAHKLSFSFSPRPEQYRETVVKSALLTSRRADVLKNRAELFAEEKKENQSKLIQINKVCSRDFVDHLCAEHRIEVEKLLLEISRLHDLVQDLQQQNRHQVNRIKQQSEQLSLMRISSLRQCQIEELQNMEIQLKGYKKNYSLLEQEHKQLKLQSVKQIEGLEKENIEHRETIKKLIEQKNIQVYDQKRKNQKFIQSITLDKETQIIQMKELMEKQMKKIQNRLQKKEQQISQIQGRVEKQQSNHEDFEKQIEFERQEMNSKLETVIRKHKTREEEVTNRLKSFYEGLISEQQVQDGNNNQLFQKQIEQLTQIIRFKDNEVQRYIVLNQTQRIESKFMQNYLEDEIKYLKECLKKQRIDHQQESELLKVKMSTLHRNDIECLTKLYEKRIQDLVLLQQRTENILEDTENSLVNEKKQFYESKKQSDYQISKLQEQLLRARMGLGSLQTDMKEKLQNQKSMLMFTSRNFIKQVELKTANNKFYEEQLRKLRHLLDVQASELEESQKNVEEKIKLAEDQLTRLSNKILEVKAEAEQSETKYKQMIKQRDIQIRRLNVMLNSQSKDQEKQAEQNADIMKLEAELDKKLNQLGSQKMKSQQLEDQVRMLKSEIQRLMIETQINSQDAKKHYKIISDKNLNDMKSFYDKRMKQLELDKKELEKINSSQVEKITELIKKYKQAEQSLRELIKQNRKRGDLQNKIINIGMDTNLVKNMAELFKK